MEPSLIISCLALGISALTAWLTWFHRGNVKMTRPSVVYFGPDQSTQVKIYLRALLYSTARRGQLVETMFAKLRRDGDVQTFNVWVYGPSKSSVRGSGLFVGYEGVAETHSFLPPKGIEEYQFSDGAYTLEVYAKLVNAAEPALLLNLELSIDAGEAIAMVGGQVGLYFDWDEESKAYQHALDNRSAGSKMERAFRASLEMSDGG